MPEEPCLKINIRENGNGMPACCCADPALRSWPPPALTTQKNGYSRYPSEQKNMMRHKDMRDRDTSALSVRLSTPLRTYRNCSSYQVNLTQNDDICGQDFLQTCNKGPFFVLLIKTCNIAFLNLYRFSPLYCSDTAICIPEYIPPFFKKTRFF